MKVAYEDHSGPGKLEACVDQRLGQVLCGLAAGFCADEAGDCEGNGAWVGLIHSSKPDTHYLLWENSDGFVWYETFGDETWEKVWDEVVSDFASDDEEA